LNNDIVRLPACSRCVRLCRYLGCQDSLYVREVAVSVSILSFHFERVSQSLAKSSRYVSVSDYTRIKLNKVLTATSVVIPKAVIDYGTAPVEFWRKPHKADLVCVRVGRYILKAGRRVRDLSGENIDTL